MLERLGARARSWSRDATSLGSSSSNGPSHSNSGEAPNTASANSNTVPPPPPPPPPPDQHATPRERAIERDELEAEINRLDQRISSLDQQVKRHRTQLTTSQSTLHHHQLRQLVHVRLSDITTARSKREAQGAAARTKVYRRDWNDHESLTGYAELVVEAAPSNVDSQYALRVQRQLQKAEKKMEAHPIQMGEVETKCEEMMNGLIRQLTPIIEERSAMEMEMASQLKVLRRERTESEDRMRRMWEKEEGRRRRKSRERTRLRRLNGCEDDEGGEAHEEEDDTEDGKDGESDDSGEGASAAASAAANETSNKTDGLKAESISTSVVEESISHKESREAKLAFLRGKIEELKSEGSQTEQRLLATLRDRREEIARLKAAQGQQRAGSDSSLIL